MMTKTDWLRNRLANDPSMSDGELVRLYKREVGGELSAAMVYRIKAELRSTGAHIPKRRGGRRKKQEESRPRDLSRPTASVAFVSRDRSNVDNAVTPAAPVLQSLELIESGLDRLIHMAIDINAADAMLQAMRRARRFASAEILKHEEGNE